MTREEAISIIQYTFLNVDNHLNGNGPKRDAKDINEALLMAIKALLNHSLPSNLDEAAEEYVVGVFGANYGQRHTAELLRAAFKAGAEWMAGQGETHELTVESPVLGPPMICCPVHADNGDKVVVQIRKK